MLPAAGHARRGAHCQKDGTLAPLDVGASIFSVAVVADATRRLLQSNGCAIHSEVSGFLKNSWCHTGKASTFVGFLQKTLDRPVLLAACVEGYGWIAADRGRREASDHLQAGTPIPGVGH